ncbi:MAG TPA: EamA family transporter [Candidatus Saccharimonadales bacterium]|nr:EamA family transporter [Candidatus Saccharimonadales bacterium]
MSWQIAIILHLIFTAMFALVQRNISRQFQSHARVATAFFYPIVSLMGITYGALNYDISFNFSIYTWLFLAANGFIFASTFISAFKSNSHIDAAQFAILQSTRAIFTVIIAAIILGERMNELQLLGILVLTISAGLVAVRRTTAKTFTVSKWSWLAIFSAFALALATTNEKYFLGEMNVGTYMVIGWGFQTMAVMLLATGRWHTLKDFGPNGIKQLVYLGILRGFQGITFVLALSQVDVSLIAGIMSYQTVLIFIGGIIFLHEREHLYRRFAGSMLATVGLLLLF